MANEFVEIISTGAISNIQQADKELRKLLDTMKIAVAESNRLNNNTRSTRGGSSPSQSASNTAANNTQIERNAQLIERQRLAEIRLQQQREKAFDQYEKKLAREAQALERSNNLYNKVQAKIAQLSSTYNNLAVKKELGLTLTDRENAQLQSLEGRLNRYQNVLKAVDGRIGKYQRNVGNYGSAFNGLNNSINQVTRELPAFAVSMNTGFLAISNNLPILFDEINRIKEANKALIAQGKPVQSVFSQIGAAVFSFQSLLSIGVTLLTLYGGRLIEWATSASKASKQIDQLTAASDRYNQTLVETTTNSEVEMTNLKRLLAVAKDETKSRKERESAAKQLIDKYPGYLQGMSKESILLSETKQNTEKYNKAVRTLTKDIQARVDAESKQKASRENLKIAAELEQEAKIREDINQQARDAYNLYGQNSKAAESEVNSLRKRVKARQEILKDDQSFIEKYGELNVAQTGSVDMLGLYEPSQIVELQTRAQRLRQIVETEQGEINKIFKETSLLDYKEDKDTKEKKVELLKDFVASEYALTQERLKNEAEFYKQIFTSEENGYADREHALMKYGQIQLKIAESTRIEELRLIEQSSKNEIAELQRRAKNGEITSKNALNVIKSQEKQASFDRQTVYEKYSKAVIDANYEIENSLKGVTSGLTDQERQIAELNFAIANLRQVNSNLRNVDSSTTLAQFQQMENSYKRLQDSESDFQISQLRDKRESLQNDIDRLNKAEKTKENNDALNKLLTQQLQIDQQILEIDNKRKQAVADLEKQMRESTQNYLSDITSNAIGDAGFDSLAGLMKQTSYQIINELGEIETKTGSTFQKLFDQAGTTGQKFAVVFNSIGEVAKEAFAFINQNSQAYFDAEASRLQRAYDLEISFNEGSETAKAEIKRQYDEKQRELRRRELQAQKEQALFNIAINTAQGITAALTSTPPNVPLSIIIGAIGVAQAAIVSAREIPAYKMGTDYHKGGLAIVGDGGKHELVHQPTLGWSVTPAKDTIVNLEKGSKVFPDLSKVGLFDSGLPDMVKLQGSDMSESTQNSLVRKLAKVMPKPSNVNIGLDRNGLNTYVETSAGIANDRNRILKMSGGKRI